MPVQGDSVSRLVYELSKLPGVGEKTATRLAYYILKQDESYAKALSEALLNAKLKTQLCRECFTFTDRAVCPTCSDFQRDQSVICIVEKPSDVFSIENSMSFKGVYHVLHGALSPLDGIGPDELKIRELLLRLQTPVVAAADSAASESTVRPPVREVILATNPSVEGEATALYLTRLLKPMGLKITKLAHGIPVGGTLEYTDRQTIGKAFENRLEMQ